MVFSFNSVAGIKPTNAPAPLEGNKIHVVIFEGVESVDVTSTSNGQTYKLMRIKFSNSEGQFVKTYFEPDDKADQPVISKTSVGDIVNPSPNVQMLYTLKQLLAIANPAFNEKIDRGEVNDLSSWDSLRAAMVAATKDFIGQTCQIKLIKNSKGEAILPGTVVNFNKENQLYPASTVIGKNLTWTKKEKERIEREASAQPTPVGMPSDSPLAGVATDPVVEEPVPETNFNMNFL